MTTHAENNLKTAWARRSTTEDVAATLKPPLARPGVTSPPENRRKAGGGARAARGRFAPGASGNPARRFQPGVSANPGGRPKGSGTYRVQAMWADALDPETRQRAVEKLRVAVTNRKSVVAALESAARINREIGLGSENQPSRVSINIFTNIDPEKLKAGRHTNIDPMKLREKRPR